MVKLLVQRYVMYFGKVCVCVSKIEKTNKRKKMQGEEKCEKERKGKRREMKCK